jgi:DNA-binding Lrp family transcriptional regulator
MSVSAYILIQTEVGKAAQVADEVRAISGVISADDVTGPYDVIARADSESMDDLDTATTECRGEAVHLDA